METMADTAERIRRLIVKRGEDAALEIAQQISALESTLAPGLVHVCAWCERENRLTLLGSPMVSHGICPACAEKQKHLRSPGKV
jgi:hypothetical protein